MKRLICPLKVGIAQLVERWVVAPEVVGSSPTTYPPMTAAMQFVVSTPSVRLLLENTAQIPLTDMVDVSFALHQSSVELANFVLQALPYDLSVIETSLLSISELHQLSPLTNIYQQFPNEHSIVMSP